MLIARVKISGEKDLVGEAAAQRHENQELVVHIRTENTNRLDSVSAHGFVLVQLFYFRRQPPQIIVLAPSLCMLRWSIFQLLAQVFRFIATSFAAFELSVCNCRLASWNHTVQAPQIRKRLQGLFGSAKT